VYRQTIAGEGESRIAGVKAQQRDDQYQRQHAECNRCTLAQRTRDDRGQTQRQSALDGGFSHA
jgi:hypothetical protein